MQRDEQFFEERSGISPVQENADTNIYITPKGPREQKPAPVIQTIYPAPPLPPMPGATAQTTVNAAPISPAILEQPQPVKPPQTTEAQTSAPSVSVNNANGAAPVAEPRTVNAAPTPPVEALNPTAPATITPEKTEAKTAASTTAAIPNIQITVNAASANPAGTGQPRPAYETSSTAGGTLNPVYTPPPVGEAPRTMDYTAPMPYAATPTYSPPPPAPQTQETTTTTSTTRPLTWTENSTPYSPPPPPPAPPAPQTQETTTTTSTTQPLMGDENSVPYSAAANTTRTQDNTSRSQVGSEELAAPPKTSNKTTTTRKVIPAKTEKKTGVNWGGIVKGVAIVAAVVVVGVGVFYGGSALATWAMSSPAVSGVANSVVGAVEPVLATANNGVEWLKGYLPWVDNIVGGFFRGLFGMEAAGAGVAATAAPAVTTPFTAAVVKNIPGAVGLLGAGGALSVAFHSAFPALGDISLFNHSTVTTPPMEQVDVTNTVTTHPDSANVAAPGHEGNHDLAQAAELGLNSQEISHHAVHGHTAMRHESHTPTSDQAVDAGGDANGDVGANDLSAPDVDVDENAVSKTSWKNRVAPDGRTAGKKGFLANFLASRNPDTAEVTARPSEYTAAIKEDRANASLAEARI